MNNVTQNSKGTVIEKAKFVLMAEVFFYITYELNPQLNFSDTRAGLRVQNASDPVVTYFDGLNKHDVLPIHIVLKSEVSY